MYIKQCIGTGQYSSTTSQHRAYKKLTVIKFGLEKLETSSYRLVQNAFRYLEPFRRGHKCYGRTDRRTDRTGVSKYGLTVRRALKMIYARLDSDS